MKTIGKAFLQGLANDIGCAITKKDYKIYTVYHVFQATDIDQAIKNKKIDGYKTVYSEFPANCFELEEGEFIVPELKEKES